MSWLEDALAGLQSGGAPQVGALAASPFPAIEAPPDEAALAAAAREAAGQRMIAANQRRINPFGFPDQNSAGIQLALDNAPAGTGVPTQGSGAAFGVPSSLQLAQAFTSPPQPQQPAPLPPATDVVPLPQPRPLEADAPQSTDVSAARRAPLGMAGNAPAMQSAAPAAAPASEPDIGDTVKGFGDAIKGFAPALLGVGGALQGDGGATTLSILKTREAQAQQAQTANVTAKALLAKGAPTEDVAAALKSPELLKALVTQYYGKEKNKFQQIGESEDRFGKKTKTYGIVNEQDGTVTPYTPPAGSEPPSTGDGGPQLNDAQQNRVKAIVEGREPYPANSRAPDAAAIREAVHAADPNFDAVNYNSRQQTRKNFTSGKAAGNVTAFNTAIGHLDTLANSIDGLGNRSSPWWNRATQPISENLDPKYAANLKQFHTARTAVADELTRAFRGSGGNVHDIVQWEKAINDADSPEALHAAVKQAAELLNSRIVALGDEYNRGMGTTKDPMELLNPKAAKSFQHLLEGSRSTSAPVTSGKTANGISWSIN